MSNKSSSMFDKYVKEAKSVSSLKEIWNEFEGMSLWDKLKSRDWEGLFNSLSDFYNNTLNGMTSLEDLKNFVKDKFNFVEDLKDMGKNVATDFVGEIKAKMGSAFDELAENLHISRNTLNNLLKMIKPFIFNEELLLEAIETIYYNMDNVDPNYNNNILNLCLEYDFPLILSWLDGINKTVYDMHDSNSIKLINKAASFGSYNVCRYILRNMTISYNQYISRSVVTSNADKRMLENDKRFYSQEAVKIFKSLLINSSNGFKPEVYNSFFEEDIIPILISAYGDNDYKYHMQFRIENNDLDRAIPIYKVQSDPKNQVTYIQPKNKNIKKIYTIMNNSQNDHMDNKKFHDRLMYYMYTPATKAANKFIDIFGGKPEDIIKTAENFLTDFNNIKNVISDNKDYITPALSAIGLDYNDFEFIFEDGDLTIEGAVEKALDATENALEPSIKKHIKITHKYKHDDFIFYKTVYASDKIFITENNSDSYSDIVIYDNNGSKFKNLNLIQNYFMKDPNYKGSNVLILGSSFIDKYDSVKIIDDDPSKSITVDNYKFHFIMDVYGNLDLNRLNYYCKNKIDNTSFEIINFKPDDYNFNYSMIRVSNRSLKISDLDIIKSLKVENREDYDIKYFALVKDETSKNTLYCVISNYGVVNVSLSPDYKEILNIDRLSNKTTGYNYINDVNVFGTIQQPGYITYSEQYEIILDESYDIKELNIEKTNKEKAITIYDKYEEGKNKKENTIIEEVEDDYTVIIKTPNSDLEEDDEKLDDAINSAISKKIIDDNKGKDLDALISEYPELAEDLKSFEEYIENSKKPKIPNDNDKKLDELDFYTTIQNKDGSTDSITDVGVIHTDLKNNTKIVDNSIPGVTVGLSNKNDDLVILNETENKDLEIYTRNPNGKFTKDVTVSQDKLNEIVVNNGVGISSASNITYYGAAYLKNKLFVIENEENKTYNIINIYDELDKEGKHKIKTIDPIKELHLSDPSKVQLKGISFLGNGKLYCAIENYGITENELNENLDIVKVYKIGEYDEYIKIDSESIGTLLNSTNINVESVDDFDIDDKNVINSIIKYYERIPTGNYILIYEKGEIKISQTERKYKPSKIFNKYSSESDDSFRITNDYRGKKDESDMPYNHNDYVPSKVFNDYLKKSEE